MLRVLPAGLCASQKIVNCASQVCNSHIPAGFGWRARKERQLGIFSLNTLSRAASETRKSLLGICRAAKRNSADPKALLDIEPPEMVMFKEKQFYH